MVNPKVTTIIDEISPSSSYRLYHVSYPFGAKIFDGGVLFLPNSQGKLVALGDGFLSNKLNDQLSYRDIPIGLVLKKSLENHIEFDDCVVPLTIFPAGNFFGIWETLDPPYIYFPKIAWNLTSGVRSLFFLPKISEESGYKKLYDKYKITSIKPRLIKDQWAVFRDIARHKNFSNDWNCEVLFFSAKWHEKLSKDTAWAKLRAYFYDTVWQQSIFWRHEVMFNLIWKKFVVNLERYNIKIGSYQLETLKHLIVLGLGALPSFAPIPSGANDIAPADELKKVFMEDYGLKYIPTMMAPHHFDMNKKPGFAYYSINEPSLIESVPRSREVSNLMQFTRDIKKLFDLFMETLIADDLKLQKTVIFDMLVNKVKYEFFHSEADTKHVLRPSTILPREDRDFMAIPQGYGNRLFCESSSFMRGCIRLSIN